jgi:hypothetical protein
LNIKYIADGASDYFNQQYHHRRPKPIQPARDEYRAIGEMALSERRVIDDGQTPPFAHSRPSFDCAAIRRGYAFILLV